MAIGSTFWQGARALLAAVTLAGCVADRDAGYTNALASNLVAKGHLRTDIAPRDAPFSTEDLIVSFRDIAFRYEFHFRDGELIEQSLEKPLKRWQGHIRYELAGDAVETADRIHVAELIDQLAGLTGLGFERVEGAPDLLISIAGPDGRDKISALLADQGRDQYRRRYELWRRTPSWICGATLSSDPNNPDRIVHAHVFIGAEVTGRLREACLHEEIVQSLGLTNDSDRARPSIFNDDQEFARLTAHDAILLKTLYDRRLEIGMTRAQAMPIARQILAENFAIPKASVLE